VPVKVFRLEDTTAFGEQNKDLESESESEPSHGLISPATVLLHAAKQEPQTSDSDSPSDGDYASMTGPATRSRRSAAVTNPTDLFGLGGIDFNKLPPK
jgi:hypothetical protein